MTDREAIARQFSGTGSAAPVWEALALVVDTDRCLNMGYSPWYLPTVVGDSQLRLARSLGRAVTRRLGYSAGARLLDVGCGRGGPTVELVERFGFDAVGVDLVPHNVRTARGNAEQTDRTADFCVGDALSLPVTTDSVDACVVVDAAQYVADTATLLSELTRVTRPGGVVAVSDLVRTDPDASEATLATFADAWDMAVPQPTAALRADARRAGLVDIETHSITAGSVARFRRWADLFLAAVGTPLGHVAERALSREGIDLGAVVEQVEATRPALDAVGHAVLVGRVR